MHLNRILHIVKHEIKHEKYKTNRLISPFASNAKGWVFESQPGQTSVVKIGSKSSTTAKRSATGVSVMGPRR